jgi:hypothetical protein
MADEIIIPGGVLAGVHGARMLSNAERRHLWGKRIARVAQRQRAARQLIPLCEIADWCARSATGASAAAEEQARALAYERLDKSARDGEFERGGRAIPQSEIRYLDPEMFRLAPGVPRLDPGMLRLRIGREQLDHVESIRELAAYCWLPREVARQWLAAHGYPWPAHFDPVAQTSPTVGPAAVAIRTAPPSIRTNKGGPELRAAIEAALKTLGRPGREAPWGRFCDYVRSECHVAAKARGYGDKSIQRIMRAIAAEQDKSDIADMSDMSF